MTSAVSQAAKQVGWIKYLGDPDHYEMIRAGKREAVALLKPLNVGDQIVFLRPAATMHIDLGEQVLIVSGENGSYTIGDVDETPTVLGNVLSWMMGLLQSVHEGEQTEVVTAAIRGQAESDEPVVTKLLLTGTAASARIKNGRRIVYFEWLGNSTPVSMRLAHGPTDRTFGRLGKVTAVDVACPDEDRYPPFRKLTINSGALVFEEDLAPADYRWLLTDASGRSVEGSLIVQSDPGRCESSDYQLANTDSSYLTSLVGLANCMQAENYELIMEHRQSFGPIPIIDQPSRLLLVKAWCESSDRPND